MKKETMTMTEMIYETRNVSSKCSLSNISSLSLSFLSFAGALVAVTVTGEWKITQ
jgi:hypothetical protein